MKKLWWIDGVSISYMLVHALSLNIVSSWWYYISNVADATSKFANYRDINSAINSLFSNIRNFVIPAMLILLIMHTVIHKKRLVYYLIPIICSIPLGLMIEIGVAYLIHSPIRLGPVYNWSFLFFEYTPSLIWFVLGGVLCIAAKYNEMGDKYEKI